MEEVECYYEGMVKLRPYQKEAIECIRKTFETDFRQYIEMPTGSGKTITFLQYAKTYHKRILVIVPSKQIMKQVVNSALKFWEPWEISQKGDGKDENICKLHVCIINSIRAKYLTKLAKNPFDLIIIDEAHHVQSESYKRFIKEHMHYVKDPKILGCTATPDRLDGKLLKSILYICSFKIEIEDLIDEGFLCDIEGFSVKTKIDLSDIDSHNSDFSLRQLYKKLCTENRNNMIVDLCKNEMVGRKVLIFCINVDHSKKINQMLIESGISSRHIDGKMDKMARESIFHSFRRGYTSVICNCQLLTEGFDEPSIDGIILARPTLSRSLFMQMIGRGLRSFKGKENCKIIDIVDNHKNLSGFNSILDDVYFPELTSFSSIKDIKDHIAKEKLKVTEFSIERVNLFKQKAIEEIEALPCMIEYLEINQIPFFHPVSFDEASFIIWMDKLRKEFYGSN